MAKGEYPYWLNGDGTVKEEFEEKKERRHWKAFWDEFPAWLRTAIMLAFGAGVGGGGTSFLKGHSTDEATMRRVMREELAPMKAGFKAFVSEAPQKTQLAVLKAMAREEEKQKESK